MLIRIRDAAHGAHPEVRSLNPAFRPDIPVIKLGVDIDWEPPEPAAEEAVLNRDEVERLLGGLEPQEANLVTICIAYQMLEVSLRYWQL